MDNRVFAGLGGGESAWWTGKEKDGTKNGAREFEESFRRKMSKNGGREISGKKLKKPLPSSRGADDAWPMFDVDRFFEDPQEF